MNQDLVIINVELPLSEKNKLDQISKIKGWKKKHVKYEAMLLGIKNLQDQPSIEQRISKLEKQLSELRDKME